MTGIVDKVGVAGIVIKMSGGASLVAPSLSGTTLSGSGAKASGTITVYKNGVPVSDTISANSSGAWTYTLGSAASPGDVITWTDGVGISSALTVAAVGIAPVNTVAPAISGTAQVGNTLTASTGTWTGSPAPTYTYQWNSAGSPVSGATSSTYAPQAGDVGKTITVTVTATNGSGSASMTSAATTAVTTGSSGASNLDFSNPANSQYEPLI